MGQSFEHSTNGASAERDGGAVGRGRLVPQWIDGFWRDWRRGPMHVLPWADAQLDSEHISWPRRRHDHARLGWVDICARWNGWIYRGADDRGGCYRLGADGFPSARRHTRYAFPWSGHDVLSQLALQPWPHSNLGCLRNHARYSCLRLGDGYMGWWNRDRVPRDGVGCIFEFD